MTAPYPPREVLAPLCALLASTSDGLTSFGGAIMMHVCTLTVRTLTGTIGAGDVDEELRFFVTCTVLLVCVNTLLGLYFSRAILTKCAPYGAAQAITGLIMVPVGTSLLYLGDLSVVRVCTGVFFASFAAWLLVKSFREEAKEVKDRAASSNLAASSSQGSSESLESRPPTPSISSSTAAAESIKGGYVPWPEPEEGEGVALGMCPPATATPSTPSPPLLSSPLQRYLDQRLSPLSPTTAPTLCLLTLLVSGVGAGFLNGLLGTGGPPQMVAFAVLGVHKDLIRGVAMVYCAIEVPVRIAVLVGTGRGFRGGDAGTYAAVSACAVVGVVGGTYLRRFADTRAILRVMLCLTAFAAAILMKALDGPAVVGGVFMACAGALGAALGLIKWKGWWPLP